MSTNGPILITGARVLTLAGDRPRRAASLDDLAVLPNAHVLIRNGFIESVSIEPIPAGRTDGARLIQARGRVLMPAFVDCHTHACWAGDRLDEWSERLAGVPYLDILARGGGIMSTVRSVRAASQSHLTGLLLERLHRCLAGGTTTIEIKSGYGLSAADEIKMLRAIAEARPHWPGTIIATALLGHAIDPDRPDFVNETIRETLPAVSAEFPGIAVDAFCEQSAWSLSDTSRLLDRARSLGHPIRVHADQFNSLGMTPRAVALGALSVDHLEASTAADLAVLGSSRTFGVGLPLCGLHMADGHFANLRALHAAGGAIAVATNCNPGSAPSTSMPLAIAAAVRYCGLSPQQAIAAATLNPATLLGFTDRGAVQTGHRADLLLLRHTDERALAYELAGDPIDAVICAGRIERSAGQAGTGFEATSSPPQSAPRIS